MEILTGHESYNLENYRPIRAAPPAPPPPELLHPRQSPATPEPPPPMLKKPYDELYSNKHEKLLLRTGHIETMENVRNWFNKRRSYPSQAPLTVSDIVNAALDFVFEHPIPFHRLEQAEELKSFISSHLRKTIVSRWKQYNEVF